MLRLLAFFTEIQYNMDMKVKSSCFGPFLLCFFLLSAGISTAQSNNQVDYLRRIQNGAQLYDLSRWYESAVEFRRAQEIAGNINDWSQALYWVILSELAYSDYGSALRDMDELQRVAPNSSFNRDMLYHRARVYYNQGFFDEALLLFRRFTDVISDDDNEAADRKAAAFFWMGECLYSMSRLDEAESFYSWVITTYPESPKFEASSFRIDLIRQKKIEAELLALLQWSHEESLRTSEDYQRQIRTYEYTINSYQRRIAELTQRQGNVLNSGVQEVRPGETPVISVPVPVNSSPERTVDIPQPENVPAPNNARQPTTEEILLEKAKRLGNEVQQLLNENSSGGGM